MEFSFRYHDKSFKIPVKVCGNLFSKMMGLMFKKRPEPLLFVFNKPISETIHSFFCVDFVAIWFDGNKIVDIKYVRPWRTGIKPLKKFDKLLEMPSNNGNFSYFSVGCRKV